MKIKEWKMDFMNYKGIECTAPCSMYSVLYDNKLIEDPFYGLNEKEYENLSENDCIFYSEFNLDDSFFSKDYIEIVFYGLDTICNIYVNDVLISKVKNMHRRYIFDIKNLIKQGNNSIKLLFKSPTKYFKEMNKRHFLYTNGDTIKGAAHLRKALYMSGWDWGPTLPDMGIFRDVEIVAYNHDKIEDVIINQKHYDNKVDILLEVYNSKKSECSIFADIDGHVAKLSNGMGVITLDNPKLWWPNGFGEQALYEVRIYMEYNNEIIDECTKTIGLRTVTVSQDPDEYGNEFCFMVNGEKIFAMGANYIPQDSFYARVTKEKTQKLIDSCIDANFNCIRVWGGGYYPEDDFFDICDRAGLLVWQDFMVACINIWLTSEMKTEFINEAEYNLKRIAYHPSLALLCGNNEMEMAFLRWEGVANELVKIDYLELYEKILPEICEKYAPNVFYWPASPSSGGGFDNPDATTRGDVHYWKVWHGSVPFEEYRNHKFRFCSEYGFESFPCIKTINSFCRNEDKNVFSRVIENHQKCKSGNTKILSYMSDKYLYPTTFENFVYASQLLQADAIRLGVEHFRRIRGCCMGSIYWQLNDCWPVASWSSIDYYGRYKALHYEAKRFYAPLECAVFNERGNLIVNVSNESLKNRTITLKWGISQNNFVEKYCGELTLNVKHQSAQDVMIADLNEIKVDIYRNFFYVDMYDENGKFLMRRTELFTVPKYYIWENPNIEIEVKENGNTKIFEIKADCFAKGVEIDFEKYDVILSDNYFDITNKDKYVVSCQTEVASAELMQNITVKTVYDIK